MLERQRKKRLLAEATKALRGKSSGSLVLVGPALFSEQLSGWGIPLRIPVSGGRSAGAFIGLDTNEANTHGLKSVLVRRLRAEFREVRIFLTAMEFAEAVYRRWPSDDTAIDLNATRLDDGIADSRAVTLRLVGDR